MSQQAAAKTRGASDPETSAISKIGKILAELNEAARKRVVAYTHQRYCENSEQS